MRAERRRGPCDCGHAHSAHTPGVACQRCGCDFYVEEADDRAEELEPRGGDPDAAGDRYERWLDEIGGSR